MIVGLLKDDAANGQRAEVAGGRADEDQARLERGTWEPPVMQICRVEGPVASKGAGDPLPVTLTFPVIMMFGPDAAGVPGGLAGQVLEL